MRPRSLCSANIASAARCYSTQIRDVSAQVVHKYSAEVICACSVFCAATFTACSNAAPIAGTADKYTTKENTQSHIEVTQPFDFQQNTNTPTG